MNTEDSEFERIEAEAKRRAAQDDDDTQVYVKPWVGLTPKELNTIFDGFKTWSSFQITDVCFAIEAKLKEKNT